MNEERIVKWRNEKGPNDDEWWMTNDDEWWWSIEERHGTVKIPNESNIWYYFLWYVTFDMY
jgi:hypothetical protein